MKKFDKEIVKKLMENLADVESSIKISFIDIYCALSNAEDINDVMVAKKMLLLNILQYLPTDGLYCYFCICKDGCADCSYGRIHGRCGIASSRNTSTWSKIIIKLRELQKIIEEEYWTGEELKEEVKRNEKK